jgi:hypothetical protein
VNQPHCSACNVPSDAGLQKRANFSTLIVGHAETGDQTQPGQLHYLAVQNVNWWGVCITIEHTIQLARSDGRKRTFDKFTFKLLLKIVSDASLVPTQSAQTSTKTLHLLYLFKQKLNNLETSFDKQGFKVNVATQGSICWKRGFILELVLIRKKLHKN